MKAWPLLILGLVLACASYLILAPMPSEDPTSGSAAGVAETDREAGVSEDSEKSPTEASFRREEDEAGLAEASAKPDDEFEPLPAVVGPAAHLKVRLIDGGGQPATGAHARLDFQLRQFPAPEDGEEDRFADWRKDLHAHPNAEGWIDTPIPAGVSVNLVAEGPQWHAVRRNLQRIREGEEIDLGEVAMSPARQVVGQVVGPDGNPVPMATISLKVASGNMWYGGASWSADSDQDGNYDFEGVPNGRYQVEVRAQGYALYQEDAIQIPEGGGLHQIDVQLEWGRTLRGIVLDEDRRPVAGARVFLFTAGEETWWGEWRPSLPDAEESEPGAVSAADGSFELAGLGEDGKYSVGADAEGHAAAYADVEDENSQLVIQLPLHLSIAGKVVDSEGEGVTEATVKLLRQNAWGGEPDEIATVETEAGGAFEFDPQGKGDYLLEVESTLGGLDAQKLKLERNRTDLVLQLEPTSELVIVVTDAEGEPIPRARVNLTSAEQQNRRNRVFSSRGEIEVNMDVSQSRFSGRTDAEGRARFGGIDPGGMKLSVSVDGYARHKDDFQRTGSGQELAVELHRGSGLVVVITGTSGNPVRNLPVQLSDASSGDKQGERNTDSAGRAVWKDLEPGTYQVAYRPQDARGGWRRQRDANKVAVDMPIVQLEGGEVKELPIQVQDLALATVLVHRGGKPAGGVKVRLEKIQEENSYRSYGNQGGQPTDGRGAVELAPVVPGTYELVVKPSQNAPERRERVELHAGLQELEVEVPGGEIRGQLLGHSGGISGATVAVIAARTGAEDEQSRSNHMTVVSWVNSDGGMKMQMGFADEQESTTRSDEQGRFRFRDVPDGDWMVIARAEGYGTWTSMAISVRGGQLAELPAQRLMPGAIIHGKDLGHEPKPEDDRMGYFGWSSNVQLEDASGQTISMAQLDKDGGYRFEDLPAGTYRISKGRWESDEFSLIEGETRRLNIPVEEKEE